MKRLTQTFAMLLLTLLMLVSCEETNPVETPDIPSAPKNLRANARDEASIAIKWDASASESDTMVYYIEISSTGSDVIAPVTANKSQHSWVFTTLKPGNKYTFTVYSKYSGGSKCTNPPSIMWATAKRIKDAMLYETASSYGSGLALYDATTGGAKNYKVANGDKWDIGLDTRKVGTNDEWDIGSPSLLSYNYPSGTRTTLTQQKTNYEATNNITNIDDVYDTDILAPDIARYYDFTDVTTGFVFAVKTADGNFAKVFVKANGGKLLQGASPNRYVVVDISYQMTSGIPYALFGGKGEMPDIPGLVVSTSKKVVPGNK